MKTTAARKHLVLSAIALMTAWAGSALADPYLYGSSYHDYEYRYAPERLSRERRPGAELDNWIERGNATVTLSPAFDRGIRVAAWSTGGIEPENFDYGIASAVYLFDIPYGTRQIEIKIRYEGDGRALDLNSEYALAGRAWIRSAESGNENPDEPLKGDTFLLRTGRRSETLQVPADRYVNQMGQLELHIVADGANRIDVEYIEVETFSREPRVNVIRRYVPGYRFAPWRAYGYHSLYGYNFYFPTDYGYYLYWRFPAHDSVYIGINRRWRGYYDSYYSSSRYGRYGRYNNYRSPKSNRNRAVNRWTNQLSSVRSSYERGRSADVRSRDITQVRQALNVYRSSPTPSTHIAGAYSQKRRSAVSTGRQRTIATPRTATGVKSRGAPSSASRGTTYSPTRRSIDYSRYAPPSRTSTSRSSSPYTRSRSYTPQEETRRSNASSTNRSSSSSSSSSKSRSSASSSGSSSGKSRGSASSSSSDDDDKKRR